MSVDDYELGSALICAAARLSHRDETTAALWAATYPDRTERVGKVNRPVVEEMTCILAAAAKALMGLPPEVVAQIVEASNGEQRGDPNREEQ